MGAACSSGIEPQKKQKKQRPKKQPRKKRRRKRSRSVSSSSQSHGGRVRSDSESSSDSESEDSSFLTESEDQSNEAIDGVTKVQRKRLSLIGRKVGKMNYKETDEQREKEREKVQNITEQDIASKGHLAGNRLRDRGKPRSHKTTPNSSGFNVLKSVTQCEYVAISKKGYIPYDHEKRNQDSVICIESLKTGVRDDFVVIHFFGVADGHGVVGHVVSQFVTQELPLECERRLKKIKKVQHLTDDCISDILRESILTIAERLDNSDIEIEHSGTTLCCSLIYDNMIYTANVGDSQAMIVLLSPKKKRSVIDLNELHKPELEDEKYRIQKYGGVVAKLPDLPFDDAGPFRVWNREMTGPGLAMSRSIGDGEAHDLGVSSVPTIDVRPLNADCKYICWGSDGVFEFLSSTDVAKIILKYDTIKVMAQKIVNEAVKWWRKMDDVVDDISCVLLKLPDT